MHQLAVYETPSPFAFSTLGVTSLYNFTHPDGYAVESHRTFN